MSRLPVIVGLGGVNPAGRVSCDHAYARMVIDALPSGVADRTWASLAQLMQADGDPAGAELRQWMRDHTLIRRIEHFDCESVPLNARADLTGPDGGPLVFETRARNLPERRPPSWQVQPLDGDRVRVTVTAPQEVFLPDLRVSRVTSAGQLPTGFDPARLYASRNHPRGLQITVYGASDALRSIGIEWSLLRDAVRPDEVAVYAGSGMSQLDANGYGGMMQAHLQGRRVTSKQLPLGLPQMPADFVNAYILGSVGSAGANIGACATFLYNLRQGLEDIRSGRRRVVVVGNAEAPITPEVIEGYRTMGALAEDDALSALDGRTGRADNRRACRPFSDNCGFTLAESSVWAVLVDDTLALELGANILGAVPDVYVNADGFKKSIPGPGIGNYVTMAKAMARVRQLLGEESLRRRSIVQAHGTGTPQNRVTESHIFDALAGTFGIDRWLVGAIKAYVGHSLAPAAGDQLAATLGIWRHGVVPGITTIDHVADDVHRDHLEFPLQHVEVGPRGLDAAFINSKGFGGNNATAVVLAPHVCESLLTRRHGREAMDAWRHRRDATLDAIATYDAAAIAGTVSPIYQFGEGVLEGSDLEIDDTRIRIPGFARAVDLVPDDPWSDLHD